MHGRAEFFDITKPGEYGQPHRPCGFIAVTHEKLGNQRIFISSQNFRKFLANHYDIPEERIVNLIGSLPGRRSGIPETKLEGKAGLALFNEYLDKLQNVKEDILIHCKQGRNRSPVAAVIYLISRGLTPIEARKAVVNAFQSQRQSNFRLNFLGHYTAVLQVADCLQENSNIPANLEPPLKNCRHGYALRNRRN